MDKIQPSTFSSITTTASITNNYVHNSEIQTASARKQTRKSCTKVSYMQTGQKLMTSLQTEMVGGLVPFL